MTSSYFKPEEDNKFINPKFINSNSVSIATSIGLHLVFLALILPQLVKNVAPSEPDSTRDVSLIDLNSFERSRLPELDSNTATDSTLPPLTDPAALDSLPNTPTGVPPLTTFDTSLPSLPAFSPPTTAPSLPALPPLPSTSIYSPPIASLPSVPSVRIPRGMSSSLPDLPAPNSVANLPTPRSNTPGRPSFDPYRDNLTLNGIRNAPRDASQQAQEQLNNPNDPRQVAVNPTADISPEIAEQRQRQLVLEMQQRLRALQSDSRNTSDEEAMRNQLGWLNRVRESNPNALTALVNNSESAKAISAINITGTYPADACSKQLTGTAIYGVTVNAAGAIVGDVELLKSAGYPILNQQALREIRSTRFANTAGIPKIYQVRVSFAPTSEVCRGTIVAPPTAPETPQNTRVITPTTPEIQLPTRPRPVPSPTNTVKPETPAAPVTPVAPVTPPSPAPETAVETNNTPPAPTPAAIEPPSPPAEAKPAAVTPEVQPLSPPAEAKPEGTGP